MKHTQLLTQIYHIAILHIYIGQYYSGRDFEQNFNYILDQFQMRDSWLNENLNPLLKLMESYLL